MLTKGAIGNLANRYRAVLKKCNLINTFGSLAVASMLVLGGAGMASAAELTVTYDKATEKHSAAGTNISGTLDVASSDLFSALKNVGWAGTFQRGNGGTFDAYGYTDTNKYTANNMTINGGTIDKIIVGTFCSGVTAEGNSVTIRNATTSAGVIAVRVENTDTVKGVASKNKLAIYDSTTNGSIYAGFAEFDGGIEDGGAEYNELTIVNSTLNAKNGNQGAIAGVVDQADAGAHYNKVSISKSTLNLFVAGGAATYHDAHHNEVVISDSVVNGRVYGGRAQAWGSASYNTVRISNSTVDTDYMCGGASVEGMAGYYPGVSASNNTVELNDSTVTADVYGGYNDRKSTTDKSYVNSNSVSINGGKVTGDVYGGYVRFGEANNNTVTINNATVDGDVYGGYSGSGNATGNVVNLSNATVNGTVHSNAGDSIAVSGTSSVDTLAGAPSEISIVSGGTTLSVSNDSTTGTIAIKGTGAANDALGGDQKALLASIQGLDDSKKDFAGMEEGLISGAVSSDGTQQANTAMEDTLEMASAAPLAINRIIMNDVRKRMGDLRADKNESGVWMRWEGGKLSGDSGLTNNFNTIQIGGDTKVAKNCRFGVAGAFTHGDIDHRNGNGENETFSFSAYGTWMAENGMFADVIARVGFSNSEVNMKGQSIDLDNEALSLSAEYGWRFDICQQFFFEPQVELTYTYLTRAEAQVAYATYEVDDMDSLIGRAGAVFGWNLPNDKGSIYARASIVGEFLGDANITGSAFGRTQAQSLDGDDTWFEYGIGANVKLSEKTYIWADVERTEGAELDEEWRGTVGIRYSF